MRYGLLDTKDRVWMGDAKGPITYEDEQLARLCAEVAGVKLGWDRTRVRAVPFEEKMPLHKRDEVPCVKTNEEMEKYLDKREAGLLP